MFLTIGELALKSGVNAETIRYYESIKLLPKPQRTAGKQRRYSEEDVKRLSFIRHAREFGFEVSAVRDLLSLINDKNTSCEEINVITRDHLLAVEERLSSLKALRKELVRMLDQCKSGKIADCRIIEVLTDHAQCKTHKRTRPQSSAKKAKRT